MKRKIFSFLFILVLALSLVVTPVLADEDDPNTILSSTMWFQGTLTSDGAGGYNGTVAMVDEATDDLGDQEAGFDIYARNGVKATYDKAGSGTQNYACGTVTDHDAYTTAGGWGTYYDPDCEDWYNYQLRFEDGNWYLEYNYNVGYDTQLAGAEAPPMSGTMDWTTMYALETGAGAYYSGMGTPESNGYALTNSCTGTNSGAGAWDMDWSWGSEYIPLQYPGFDVTLSVIDGGTYRVSLEPAAAGATQLTVEVPDIVAISVDPTTIDFGTLVPGQTSGVHDIVVTNVGTHQVNVTADADTGASMIRNNLELKLSGGAWGDYRPWPNIITNLDMYISQTLKTRLTVPASYTPGGVKTAQLTFTATGT